MEEGNNALYYKMQNNITFTDAANWIPVGAENQVFAGTFDGNNSTISELVSIADADDNNIVKCQSLFGPTTGGTFKDLTLSYVGLANNYYGNAFTTTPQTASLDYCKVNSVWVFSPDKMANVIAEIETQARAFNASSNNNTVAMNTLGYMRHIRYNGGNWDVMIEKPDASFTNWMNNSQLPEVQKIHTVFKSGVDIYVTDTYTKDSIIDFIHFVAPLNSIVSQKVPSKLVWIFNVSVYSTHEQDDLLGWAGDLQSYYSTTAAGVQDGIGKRNFGVFSQEDMYADMDAVNVGTLMMTNNGKSVSKNISVAYQEYYYGSSISEQKRFQLFIDNIDQRTYATVQVKVDSEKIYPLTSAIETYTTNAVVAGTAKWQLYPAGITDPNLSKLRKEFGYYVYTHAGRSVPAAYL
ncbi:hypothetical protein [Methanolapillus millepedarum]|uniref:Uncharacterized protein n=1 Tax=Methanolapillus millepedarum TaxID=3028296 RepID=A0AA96V237_9EURY|nr:hypothetical protein MsAc7_06130 [Methanosarcinaceae archaeon Ac7]